MELCVNCKTAYRTIKTGVTVEETAGFGSYKLWDADLKECPKCKHQIVGGFAREGFAEHYQKGYEENLKRIKEKERVYEWSGG